MTDYTKEPEVREATQLVAGIVERLRGYKITTAQHYTDGAEQLKQVKAAQKRLEDVRTKITGPLNAALRAVNDLFRNPAAELVRVEGQIKGELSRYADEQERKRREEQRQADEKARKERERIEQQAARAQAAGKEEKAEQLQQRAETVVAPVIQREAPRVAGVAMREVARFEIVDASKLPREYLIPDEQKIRKVVAALKTDANIPGVRVWLDRQIAAGAA